MEHLLGVAALATLAACASLAGLDGYGEALTEGAGGTGGTTTALGGLGGDGGNGGGDAGGPTTGGMGGVADGSGGAGGAGLGVAYATLIANDSPDGYWRFGEPSGTIAFPTMGVVQGNYLGGVFNLGAEGAIVGDDDTAVELVSGETGVHMGQSFDFPDAFTLEIWAKPTGGNTRTCTSGGMISREYGTACQTDVRQGYNLRIHSSCTPRFEVVDCNGAILQTVNNSVHLDETWHHVVGTYEAPNARLFVDGVEVASATVTGNVNLPGDQDFVIGIRAGPTGFGNFEGVLDDAAVYSHALSLREIANHYAIGSQRR